MKISGGISEVSLNSIIGSSKPDKIYLWPNYDAGKVERVDKIVERPHADYYYSKPTEAEKYKLLDIMNTNMKEYSSNGSINKKVILPPGSFFEALV
jgi:predicted class III extradiol MEMO1 family dioxygenase